MSVNERAVYHAIVTQYLLQFLPEKCYQAANVVFRVEGIDFAVGQRTPQRRAGRR
ncbi:hypothetical protein NGK36_22515 [Hafnia alvei]|uniref:hypothetical protein n=1 Tax=Hafnia alvei TaxID=569 RepID=UPI0024A9E6A1|nr:hypothetical protein [Hafnia alvei]MEB7892024.1 hypothetical protein [Hafnia alvei]